jgi:hypothetical protein
MRRTTLAVVVAAFVARSAPAATVTNLNDSGDGSLRAAVAATPAGGIVDFAPGLTGTIVLASPITFSDLTISGPGADVLTVSGGNTTSIFAMAGTTTLAGLRIADGVAPTSFGGVVVLGTPGPHVVRDCVFEDNLAAGDFASALRVFASVTVDHCTFHDNHAESDSHGHGGALLADNTMVSPGPLAVVVRDSTFVGNTAGFAGGALAAAIFLDGPLTVTIERSTFVDNAADEAGAIEVGAVNAGSVVARIANTTFVGNTAAVGSALLSGSVGEPVVDTVLVNDTVVAPAGTGPAVVTDTVPLTLTNTIITAPTAGGCMPRIGASFVNGGHNLATDATCGFGAGADDVDPRLDPAGLGDNGGLTQTIALLPDSPAIDAGDDAACAGAPVDGVDQRGVARPMGAHCDIGAFEVSATTVTTTSSSSTTTTLPVGCAEVVDLAAVSCRVDALTGDVDAVVPAGKIRTKLDAKLGATAAQIGKAQALVAQGKTKPGKASVKRALKAIRAVAKRIRSGAVGKVIAGDAVARLGEAADRIAGELSTLKKEPR